jgi:hypothetical protein
MSSSKKIPTYSQCYLLPFFQKIEIRFKTLTNYELFQSFIEEKLIEPLKIDT